MKLLKSKRFYCALALLALPATLNALSDSYFDMSLYGSVGSNNYMGGLGSLGVGWSNWTSSSASNSAVIGTSLQATSSNSLVVGAYNNPTPSAAFIVGNGTGSDPSLRKNALEVLTDGTVKIPGTAYINKIPARGGISMGIYGP